MTTPGFTNRYLRHQDSLAYTEVVDAASSSLLKADATYTIRAGLADAGCYSFESVNFPGQYLRHQNSRVRNSPDDGSALLRADATWCARVGLTGTRRVAGVVQLPGQVPAALQLGGLAQQRHRRRRVQHADVCGPPTAPGTSPAPGRPDR